MVAIMLAVARWCSGNHSAASLAGEKMTRVWARAQRLCPAMRKAKGSLVLGSTQGRARRTLPEKFSHAHRMVYRDKGALASDLGTLQHPHPWLPGPRSGGSQFCAGAHAHPCRLAGV